MQVPAWIPDKPRSVLLATDLSSRCDRALDRAMFLVREWGARLVVLTVVEADASPQHQSSPAHRRASAYNRVLRDIASSDADLAVEVVVREGDVGDRIVEVAAEAGCSLIVTGTARNELFGRILLGSTVERLSRTSQLPLLAVHRRVHGPYARVVVASDFSASSQHSLDTSVDLLPDTQPIVFHAFDIPFLGMMDMQRDEVMARGQAEATAVAQQFLRDAGHPTLPVVVAHGDPAERLREYAETHDTDLIVVASHGRSAIYKVLIGSVARRILETAPCDTLLVPELQARAGR